MKSSYQCLKEGSADIPTSQMIKARHREIKIKEKDKEKENTLTSFLEIIFCRISSWLLSYLFISLPATDLTPDLGCTVQFNSASMAQISRVYQTGQHGVRKDVKESTVQR